MSDNSLLKQQNAVLAGTGHPWAPKTPEDGTRIKVDVTIDVALTYYAKSDGCNHTAGWDVDERTFAIIRRVVAMAEAQAQADWEKDHGGRIDGDITNG